MKPGTKEVIEKVGREVIVRHMEEAKEEARKAVRDSLWRSNGETDPLGKKANEPGAKMDSGKVPLLRGVVQYFPLALEAVAKVSLKGAEKYTWKGWETVPDGINRYGDALLRHLTKEITEGPLDLDTGFHHASHAAWNALARLELILRAERAG